MSREFLPAAGGKIAPKYNLVTVKKCVSQFEQPSKMFRLLHSSEEGFDFKMKMRICLDIIKRSIE